MSLRTELATPEGKGRYVRRLFSTIADRYDLITVLLSYGQDRRWKRQLAEMARVRADQRALDLASGTGDIAFELADRGASVIGLDITRRMVELACAKGCGQGRAPRFLVGDMMALPFSDQSFDLVTAGYGVRNVSVLGVALREIHRVLRPGGRLLSLDFNRPENGALRAIYLAYLTLVGSALGFVLHGDPDTYRYIPASIRLYPGASGVALAMQATGFVDCGYVKVLGGLMAINFGEKGADGPPGRVGGAGE